MEQNTLISAERVRDVIKHSTTEYMLRNDQEGLHHAVEWIDLREDTFCESCRSQVEEKLKATSA